MIHTLIATEQGEYPGDVRTTAIRPIPIIESKKPVIVYVG